MIGKHIPRRETSSFERLNDYVLNRNGRGEDAHKVLFAGHFNLLGDLRTATYEMEAVAAKNTRVKIPADHFLLSWRAGEQPTEKQAREAVAIALEELDLSQNQCVWALHQNTDNVHLHIAVNRIDVQTHRAIAPAHGWTRKAMERAARRIEFTQGWSVERNAWSSVDENGTIIEAPRKEPELIEEYNIPQRVVDKENHTGEKSAIRTAKDKMKKLKQSSWAELHEQLASLGMSYEKKGSGAVIFVGDVPIKASDAGKRFALNALEKKLGAYEPPAFEPIRQSIAPEPLTRKNDNDDWYAYEAYRKEYYKSVGIVRDAVRAHMDKERKELSASQKQERDAKINGRSRKGHGEELNAIRSELAAKQARERLDLKERHAAMRKKCREMYPPLPSYEEWLRLENKDLDAEAWRHRADQLFDVATLTPPIGFADESAPVKDLRGFTSSVRKHGVAFTAKNGSNVSFIDYGKQIRIYEQDPAAVLAALQLGMQKWGSVAIQGSPAYRQMCIELAAKNGIKLSPQSLQREAYQYQDKQMKKEREADSERVASARDAFAKYHAAVGAERYRVTATQFFESGGKRGFMVNRQDGEADGFTPEQMIDKMSRLVALEQTDNRNIYFTPISETKHHLVIDDLTPESLAEMISDGYEPCAVIETSPNNWQAIITIPKMGTDLDRQVANAVVAELNKKYGDPKFTGSATRRELINSYHPHRAPGFENRKPKHKKDDSTYPDVRLVKSRKVECPKAIELAKSHHERLSRQETERTKRIGDVTTRSSDVPTGKAYAAHFEDVYQAQQKKEAKTGKPTDMSRLDLMIATRLRATGHSKEEIAEAIEVMSPRMRDAVGKDPHAHNWKDYAARTASTAFGYKGDKEIEKYASYVRQWESIEGKTAPTIETPKTKDPAKPTVKTSTPKTLKTEQTQDAPAARPTALQKTEAPKSKPLSLKADKDRLSELADKVNAHANAYTKQKMDEVDDAEADRLRPLIKEAKKELADAEEAYKALHEQGPGIRWYHTKKKAAELQEAFNEEIGRLDMLRQHASKRVHDLKYGHVSHSAQEARQSQIDGFKRKGRDEYDSQHLEEAAERKELEQVVGLSEKHLVIVDPLKARPTFEKQREDVLKLIEVERVRGLTDDEATAKHEIIRKFLDTLDKTQAKIAELQMKGQDRDRDMER